jgi:hypothetical protein
MTSRHQNAGQNHNIQADDEYLENVADVTCLGKTATDRNWACEEVTSWRAAQRVTLVTAHSMCGSSRTERAGAFKSMSDGPVR